MDYLDKNADEIVRRFEQYLSGENSGYFDIEELETISEYYLHKGRTKDSNRALDVGLRLHPASSELQIKRAKTFLATGEIHKALSILNRLPESDNYEAQLLKIDALSKLNRTEEAELLADYLLSTNTIDLDNICLDIAFVFLGQENFQIAQKFLLQGDKYNSKNIDLLFELAYTYEQTDNYEKTIESYNRIIDIDSYVGEAWFNLGQVYFVHEDYTKALEAYDFCTAIDDSDMLVWLQKGHVHFHLGQFAEAIKSYEQYALLSTDKWQINTFIGECYEKMEDFTRATEYYQKSIEEEPYNYDGYVGKAICMLEQDMYKESIPIIEKAISLNDNAYDAYVYLAEAYSNLDNLDKAADAYQKSLNLEPEQADTLVAYGNLLMDMERYDDALQCYIKAVKMDNKLEHIYLLLSVAYAKTEDYENMFGYLDMASNQNPKAIELFFEMCPEVAETISNVMGKLKSRNIDNQNNINEEDE